MNKNKQKRTMKQKVSQKVIVNIKNAMPKSKPKRRAGTGISKSKSLSSQYTNPYLIGSYKQQVQTSPDSGLKKDITDMRKLIEQERQSNLLEAQGRAHQITAQNANVAGMQQMMHFGMNALMKEIKAKPVSSGVSIEDVSRKRGPYKKKANPVENLQSNVASLIQQQAQEQAQAIQQQAPPVFEAVDEPPDVAPPQQVHLVLPTQKMSRAEATARARHAKALKRQSL